MTSLWQIEMALVSRIGRHFIDLSIRMVSSPLSGWPMWVRMPGCIKGYWGLLLSGLEKAVLFDVYIIWGAET
jgi:hypothetical protein